MGVWKDSASVLPGAGISSHGSYVHRHREYIVRKDYSVQAVQTKREAVPSCLGEVRMGWKRDQPCIRAFLQRPAAPLRAGQEVGNLHLQLSSQARAHYRTGRSTWLRPINSGCFTRK